MPVTWTSDSYNPDGTPRRTYGGFQNQSDWDAYRQQQAQRAQSNMVWNGQSYVPEAQAMSQNWGAQAAAGQPVVGGGTSANWKPANNPTPIPLPRPIDVPGTNPGPTTYSDPAAYGQGVSVGPMTQPGGTAMSAQGVNPNPAAPQLNTTMPQTNSTLYGMGVQGLGMGLQPFQAPYLNDVSQSLWNQAKQQWNDVINPGIQQASVASGNFGDRAQLARGVMMDRLNQSVFNAMAPQYNQAYNAWLDRGVQAGNAALGQDVNYGNIGLGYYGADTNRQLGLGTLSTNQYNAETQRQSNLGNLQNQAYDSYLKGLLGMGGLDIDAYRAQTDAARAAAGAAGVQQYTNPLLAGLGAFTSLYPFLYPSG